MKKTISKIGKKIIVGAFAFSLVFAIVPFAHADAIGDYKYDGVNIRTCGRTSCTSKGMGYKKDENIIRCLATAGDSIDGSTLWYFNQDQRTGVSGYTVAAYIVITENGPIPNKNSDTCDIYNK